MKLNKTREQMAEAFINSLNEGILPWEAAWKNLRPQNAITGKNYRGVNSLWLSIIAVRNEYKDPRWCTFNQAKDKGWSVRKGEKSPASIEFWSLYDKKTKKCIDQKEAKKIVNDDPDREDDIILMSRVYAVFNAAQIEGIPELEMSTSADIDYIRSRRDVLIQNMDLDFREAGSEAFYSPSQDCVTMPPAELFHDTYGYMSTFLHECGHATGHSNRLNRDLSGGFGSESYAKEELRAEIASAFTAQELGLGQLDGESDLFIDNHKAYIQSWIQVIQDQPNELFSAIKDAEAISDYLLEKGEFQPEQKSIPRKLPLDKQIELAEKRASMQVISKEAGERQGAALQ